MEVPSGYKLLTLFTKFTLFTLFELLTLLTLLPSITVLRHSFNSFGAKDYYAYSIQYTYIVYSIHMIWLNNFISFRAKDGTTTVPNG